jgi:hypothetical protein
MGSHPSGLRGFVARHRIPVAAGSVVVVLALIWCGLRLSEYVGHQTFERRLTELVAAAPDGATVDLRAATSFPWQRAYIFGAYLPDGFIDKKVGFTAFAPWDFVIPSNDGDQLLVLVGDGQVRGYMNLSQFDGPFTFGGDREDGFPADQASLIVHRLAAQPGRPSWPYLSLP